MIKFNLGAHFPYQHFAALERGAIRQLMESVDLEALLKAWRQASAQHDYASVRLPEIVIGLLAFDRDQEAVELLKGLCNSMQIEARVAEAKALVWMGLLNNVVPSVVALEKWTCFQLLIEQDFLDPLTLCGAYTVAGQVCIVKEWYARALEYMLIAQKQAALNPIIITEAIEEYIRYINDKLNGTQTSFLHGHFTAGEQQDEQSAPDDDGFDWDEIIKHENDQNWDPYAHELSEQEKILRKWQVKLGGGYEQRPWRDPEDLAHFFQRFRPHGEHLDEFCADMDCSGMLSRLLEIFRATADGYKTDNVVDAYFVVRKPMIATDAELETLTREYFVSLVIAGNVMFNKGLQWYFSASPAISIKRGEQAPAPFSEIDHGVHDALREYFTYFPLRKRNAQLLHEALYTMAADYNIAHYILWPITQLGFDHGHEDPYSKYFELWKRGVTLRYADAKEVFLYAPNHG